MQINVETILDIKDVGVEIDGQMFNLGLLHDDNDESKILAIELLDGVANLLAGKYNFHSKIVRSIIEDLNKGE